MAIIDASSSSSSSSNNNNENENGVTYRQVHDLVNRVRCNLSKYTRQCDNDNDDGDKQQQQQVLALMLPNHTLFPILFHGALSTGRIIITPINPLCSTDEIRRQLVDSGARHLIMYNNDNNDRNNNNGNGNSSGSGSKSGSGGEDSPSLLQKVRSLLLRLVEEEDTESVATCMVEHVFVLNQSEHEDMMMKMRTTHHSVACSTDDNDGDDRNVNTTTKGTETTTLKTTTENDNDDDSGFGGGGHKRDSGSVESLLQLGDERDKKRRKIDKRHHHRTVHFHSVHAHLLSPLPPPTVDNVGNDDTTATTTTTPTTTTSHEMEYDEDMMDRVAILPYSSGTTGWSKGVQLTHRNLIANLMQIESIDPQYYNHELRMLGLMPMFHIYGLNFIMNKSLQVGGTLVIMNRFHMTPFFHVVRHHRLNVLHLVPPVLLAMSNHYTATQCEKQREELRSWMRSVQYIVTGAAPCAPSLSRAIHEQYGVQVRQGYGMTETSPVLCINPSHDNRPESCGVLVCDTELKIVPVVDEGEDELFGDGVDENKNRNGQQQEQQQQLINNDGSECSESVVVGELCFRGPQIMKGYWNNDRATRETIDADGWLHTGDMGYFKDGHVYITDRLKELIKYRGYQVPPAELEAILMGHERVMDAAVIGSCVYTARVGDSHVNDDDVVEELPKALIVLAPPTSKHTSVDAENEDEIKKQLFEYVAERVAPYKKLRLIEFVSEIPRTSSGKILRRVLKERDRMNSRKQGHNNQ